MFILATNTRIFLEAQRKGIKQKCEFTNKAIRTEINNDGDCLLAGSGWNILIPLASSQHNLYDIYLLVCVQY